MNTLLLFLFRIMASSKQPSGKLSPKKVRSKWSKHCPWDAVVKWFCEAGGGRAHLTKPGWSIPHTHSNPINLALFRHKITLYRFSQGGGLILSQGAQMGAGGLSPLTLTTAVMTVQ